MRIWDIPDEKLCKQHLLGEHCELHAIWSILINNKEGYAKHPEILRWKGKLKALYYRHDQQVKEMKKRSFNHNSPLDINYAKGSNKQNKYIDSIEEQIKNLKNKSCECKV